MKTLDQIGIECGTDKSSKHHGYLKIYDSHFRWMRNLDVNLLEIGVGGYEFPDRGGQSLRMWEEYFPKGTISGVDLYDKSGVKTTRSRIFQGSQIDADFLGDVIEKIGNPYIIIDDGSHHNDMCWVTFEILFRHLQSGGIYVIEDVHTSYWKEHYNGTTNVLDLTEKSTMNYFKLLTDTLNEESGIYNKDSQIESIQFYKKMIFIFKK